MNQTIEQEWILYPYWHCIHGFHVGLGCPDCNIDDGSGYGAVIEETGEAKSDKNIETD